ncbi:MAG: Gfo/Idh/MocA family oxidoreductase [Pirellulaceae bacterium]|nr:Gfo/Idh/MocA family oxidoreductase [Pirellulaceae bacterium]
MTIGFGIIGCGMIARFHARAIAEIRGAKLVACHNRTLDKAAKFAAEFPCQAYDDLDAMLARPDIDVVTICTPSGAHLEPGVMAAKAGKHVLVEKPLEVTLKRCDALIAACDKAKVRLGTIFPSRFHESAKVLKQAVDQKRFGKITLADAYVKWFRTQEYYDSGAWRGTWKLDGGGALMNQAIHSIDLLLWIMGPVAEISANTATLAHERIEVEDVATASIRFENGALGVIEASTAAYPGSLKRIEIAGSHGMATLEEESIVRWTFAKEKAKDKRIIEQLHNNTKTGGGASDPTAIGHAAHRELFKDFLKGIANGQTSMTEGGEGRRSVELILGIYQSAKSGRRIRLTVP